MRRLRARAAALRPGLPDGVIVGKHTYDYDRATFPMFTEDARIEVGSFCSIAPEVRIVGGGEHVIDRASTFPLHARLFDPSGRNRPDAVDRGPTIVGSDVWIGLRAMILAGVEVGHGAVVAAGSVVRGSVEPYAIVAGNPARLIRYRFSPEVRARLLAIEWWTWADELIGSRREMFMGNIESFLREAEGMRS